MTIGEIEPSSAALSDISAACAQLWELDDNRLEPGQDYIMNLQVRLVAGTRVPNGDGLTQ